MSSEVVHRALALLQVCRMVDPAVIPATESLLVDLLERDLAFAKPDLITGVLSALLAAAEGVTEAATYLETLMALVDESAHEQAPSVVVRLVSGTLDGGTGMVTARSVGQRWFRSGSRAGIDQLLGLIESEARFGTRPALVEEPLAAVVEGAALNAARNYDLLGMLRCLRACAYAGSQNGYGARIAADFLAASRCPSGSFGFYETPASIIRKRNVDSHPLLSVQLAVTMQSIWTLAELADPEWRLFEKVQQAEGACSIRPS